MEFYAQKSRELPRFMYRNLADALAAAQGESARTALVDAFCERIKTLQPAGDTYKMKWCLPPLLADVLSPPEAARVEAALADKRKRRNEKFLETYPHCSDEFSTSSAFLDAVFGASVFPLIDRQTKIFTFGSCFAQNIAQYLATKGYDTTPFVQVEDLNSPFSNAVMLSAATAPAPEREAYVRAWLKLIYPAEDSYDEAVRHALKELERLRQLIGESEFLIVTCGNVIDYFLTGTPDAPTLGAAVAPKFLSVSFKDDVLVRGSITKQLKEAGSTFRLGSYEEVREAMASLYRSIRAINPKAPLLLTLSPIPIDSAIGIESAQKMGAVEIDCVSKSLLRSVLHAFMLERRNEDPALYYFPSYELMRWVAPNFNLPLFGQEDANARHLSPHNLVGAYEYFLHKFGKDTEGQTAEDSRSLEFAMPRLQKRKKKKWWWF